MNAHAIESLSALCATLDKGGGVGYDDYFVVYTNQPPVPAVGVGKHSTTSGSQSQSLQEAASIVAQHIPIHTKLADLDTARLKSLPASPPNNDISGDQPRFLINASKCQRCIAGIENLVTTLQLLLRRPWCVLELCWSSLEAVEALYQFAKLAEEGEPKAYTLAMALFAHEYRKRYLSDPHLTLPDVPKSNEELEDICEAIILASKSSFKGSWLRVTLACALELAIPSWKDLSTWDPDAAATEDLEAVLHGGSLPKTVRRSVITRIYIDIVGSFNSAIPALKHTANGNSGELVDKQTARIPGAFIGQGLLFHWVTDETTDEKEGCVFWLRGGKGRLKTNWQLEISQQPSGTPPKSSFQDVISHGDQQLSLVLSSKRPEADMNMEHLVHVDVPWLSSLTKTVSNTLDLSRSVSATFKRGHSTPAMRFRPVALAVLFLCTAARPVSGKLNFTMPLSKNYPIKRSGDISFDPLGVAAILHNPRADLSAARLYTQQDKSVYRWPHTLMFGGTLTPFLTLVEHLTASTTSIHPAVRMCEQSLERLKIFSDVPLFAQLPVSASTLWLYDFLSFKPSHNPINDVMIVKIDNVFGEDQENLNSFTPCFFPRLVIHVTGITSGILLAVGLGFSVYAGDQWAMGLFCIYIVHWIISTVISFNQLVQIKEVTVAEDPMPRYAVYERPGGGIIVFSGTQFTLETWARTTYVYNRTLWRDCCHWAWILSGTLAAIASVACMVNMNGYTQMVFLGCLMYSSLAEIWVTQCARRVVRDTKHFGGHCPLPNNKTRIIAFIRATFNPDNEEYRLPGINWVKLGLLPQNRPAFDAMQAMMDYLCMPPSSSEDENAKMAEAKRIFRSHGPFDRDTGLANSMEEWIQDAYEKTSKISPDSTGDRKA